MSATDEILKASKEGDYDRVLELLDTDPHLATASSMTGAQPIHAAHFGGHKRIVELLLARCVDMDFFLAAELGIMDRVVSALNSDPDLAKAFSAAGSTALHRACYWGQGSVARVSAGERRGSECCYTGQLSADRTAGLRGRNSGGSESQRR